MEQVAEALKALQVDGKWTPKATEAFDAIKSNARIRDLVILDGYEIEAVLNAIISIYEKKAPVAEWHNCVDDSEFEPNEQYEWEHDITGEVYRKSVTIEGVYPNHANKWTDGTYGGYCFESNGVEFKTTEGVRGMGYKALVAFDRKGRGIVFF